MSCVVYSAFMCICFVFFPPPPRAPQDKIHPRDGGSHPGDDAGPGDRAAKGHHPHLLRHDAVRVPLHVQLPAGASSQTGEITVAKVHGIEN